MSENYKVLEWTRASLNNASDKRLVELTKAELQFIVSVLKKEIGIAQIQIWSSKKECAGLYEVCDSNEPASFFHFEELNRCRNALRYWKSLNKKLSAIQAKLKRAR